MKPLAPISNTARVALGILFFVLFFAAWACATLGGYVSKTFLADPLTMVEEGWLLLTKHGFLFDIGITIWRVLGGFVLAALVAVPLGILMGAYKPIEAFLEPFVSFARYLPASAFIPLLILWAGHRRAAEAPRHLHRLGVPDRADGGGGGRRACGATWSRPRSRSARATAASSARVLIPASAPDIAEILRLVLGWAWTYVIVAELIGSSSGIGHMIIDSQALLATGQIIFGIIVIGVIGLISDFLFKWGNRRLFPWSLA